MNDTEQQQEPPADRQIVVARQVYPDQLPLVIVPNRPVFPKMVTPLPIDTPTMGALFRDLAESQSNLLGVVLAQRSETEEAPPSEGEANAQRPAPKPHRMGTIVQVLKTGRSEQGTPTALLGGLDRFELKKLLRDEPYPIAEVEYRYEADGEPSDEIKAYALSVVNLVKELVQLNPLFKEELSLLINQGSFNEPGRLADMCAFLTSASGEELQQVMETLGLKARLDLTLSLLKKELDISKLQTKIRQQIEERISKQQREFFLREQLKAIKQELGLEKDDKEADIQAFLKRLETRKPSEEARTRIDEEVQKLKLLEPASPEFNITRNYLDWLTILPWGVTSEEDVELAAARKCLDENHYGLDDVKERILEFIAAGLMKGGFGGSIICLVGPPGVGKTSIGRSIARSLGREFYRFSLGGMRDEAEIKGHRRTYIGAMPGKFVQALRVCKTQDPVIMLDEIDKVGTSFRGDPASALLEALDPEQNRDFLDHYLDVRFDLSNILFVCTANQLDTIPPPLRDRMEIIKLSGYLLEEKLEIAQRFLVPRELKALQLPKTKLSISKPAIRELIDGYARDAGLRSLEQHIKKLTRKSAVEFLEKKPDKISIGPERVRDLLGRRIFTDEPLAKKPMAGVVTGLAWTSMGGDALHIEARAVRGRAGFKQTGQLGKVMVESSEIAYTHARSLCAAREQCRKFFDDHFVHLHVPAGATPKDGPSAGVTMAAALYSLANDKPIKPSHAMTGELNLSGHVMPVGGIKEKIIAAKRYRFKHVILPKANQRDFEDLAEHIRQGIKVHFVELFEEVVALCL